MIHILVVDDHVSPEFMDAMRRDIADDEGAHVFHCNPVDILAGNRNPSDFTKLLDAISGYAVNFWDVAIVDFNLFDADLEDGEKIQLSLSIAERIRQVNRAVTIILYSGTISDYIEKLLKSESPEQMLKMIFHADIFAFCSRKLVVREVQSAINNPSWLLRIDRLFTKHGTLKVGVFESEFNGKNLSDLTLEIRRQSAIGQRLVQLFAENGVSGFVDLNT